MKTLLKILLGGFVAFQVLAIAQEWQLFASAWFGWEEKAPVLSEEERQEAMEAVYLGLTLKRHLYLSGGDPRFLDRMPLADGAREEMLADVEYLGRNHRRQDPELEDLEVLEVATLAPGRLQVSTREQWLVRILWSADGSQAEPPRRQELRVRYQVSLDGGKAQVEGWDFERPGA